MKKKLLSTGLLFCLLLNFNSIQNLHAQAKTTQQFPSDEALINLVNQHIQSPIKRLVKNNGDVFLQRDLTQYVQVNLARGQNPAATAQDYGHNHNDEMVQEFLNRPQPSVATLNNYFNSAAAEFQVPVALLKATAQVQSNWAQVAASFYGSWGVMGLIENNIVHQLTLAGSLLNVSVESIKNDAQTNIRAAAVLLAHYQQQPSANIAGYFEAMENLTGLTDPAMKRELALRIYDVVNKGSKTISLWGEIIQLDPVAIQLPKTYTEAIIQSGPQTEAVDYPLAISNFTTCNYGSRPAGSTIKYYFVHYIGTGTYQGAIDWFKQCAVGSTPASNVSAHYVVRNNDGQVSQVVAEADRAWSQGVTIYNDEGVSAEHEAILTNLSMWNSEPMLVSAAKLAANVCNRNGIPKIRRVNNGDLGIYGHSDVKATDCPNLTTAQWNDLILRIQNAEANVAPPLLYSISNNGAGTNVTATWRANTEPNLLGYRLYYAEADDLASWKLVANETTLTAAVTSFSADAPQFLVPPAGDVYHFKLTAVVSNGPNPPAESTSSDVYSRSSNMATTNSKVLIVDGFDRMNGSYTGASHKFVTSYFKALRDKGVLQINSAANEKIADGTISLNTYDIVVWFIGDESSADVALSTAEKNAIKTFLELGGKLIITGSELAYNISRTTAATYDAAFTQNYLKATYVSDGAASYTPATGITGTPFEGLNIPFGMVYPEDFPDAVLAVPGAIDILNYNAASRKAGIAYTGVFGTSTTPGAIIFLSFTLETAADISISNFMQKALLYFNEMVIVSPPIAVNDAANISSGAAKIINVLQNDIDNGSPLLASSVEITALPANGSGSLLVNADGTITFTGNVGYVGTDNFKYRVSNSLGQYSNDGTVTITALAPIACNPYAPEVNDAFPKRDLRGAWVSTVSNIDWPSARTLTTAQQQTELIKILDSFKVTGINTVFLQIRPESDALYASTIDPWSYWLTGAQGVAPSPFYDPLQFAIAEAHARGLELHGWINPYRAKQSTPTLAANHVAILHPDWTFVSGSATLLNPGLPAVRDYVTSVVTDIANRYDIDGIHFDDYFYPYAGMAGQDNQTYLDHNPSGITTIEDWRRNNVNQLIAQVYQAINVVNANNHKNILFGVSPFGIWKSGVPAGISGTSSYSQVYCDPIAWLQAGTVDYLAPQLYWKITGAQDYSALSQWWNDQGALYNRNIYPGLALYKMTDANNWAATEIQQQINLNRQSSRQKISGQVMFSTKQIMANSKGIKTALQTNQYQYLSLPPALEHKDVVCPNPPQNLRQTADTLRWDAPVAASDGDVAKKYVVYKFNQASEVNSHLNNAAKIYAVTYGLKVPVSYADVNKYFVVTSLDKNNNESTQSIGVVLPIQGLLFTATLQENKVLLNWITQTETNTSRFEIERSSNGINFLPIAVKAAAGNSQTATNYHHQDLLLETGIYYYRIKIIDRDEQIKYSEIKSVVYRKNDHQIVVTPNPFKGVVNFSHVARATEVSITDVSGRVLLIKKLNNENQLSLPLPQLAAGLYYARFVQDNGSSIVVKIVKQ